MQEQEKYKPFATIYIRKPKVSRLVLGLLLIVALAIVGVLAAQEM